MLRRQKIINFLNIIFKYIKLRISNQTNQDEVLKLIKRLKVLDLGYELIRIGP